MSARPVLRGLLAFLAGAFACACSGTETGNPSLTSQLAVRAHSSDSPWCRLMTSIPSEVLPTRPAVLNSEEQRAVVTGACQLVRDTSVVAAA